jgi:hypothetical protein
MNDIKIKTVGNIPQMPVDPAMDHGARSEAAWLAACAQYGVDAPRMVKGAFSVAIAWTGGKVFCAVDRFSIHS